MNSIKRNLLIGIAVAGFSTLAADNSWQNKTAGTHDWNTAGNWASGVPTASDVAKFNNDLSGAQTITGDGEAQSLDINNNTAKTRDFTGNITMGSLVFRQGVLNLRGGFTITDDSGSYSRIGTSANAPSSTQFEVLNVYGKFISPNNHGICLPRGNNDDNTANGYMHLHDGGELVIATNTTITSSAGLLLAKTKGGTGENLRFNAGFVQSGGKSTIGRFLAGYEKGSRASIAMLGGEMDFSYVNDSTRLRVGHSGYGQFQQLGGTVYAATNYPYQISIGSVTSAMMFEIGSGFDSSSLFGASFYSAGGEFYDKVDFLIQGNSSYSTANKVAPASATFDGNGFLQCYRILVGVNRTSGRAILNVNGSSRIETYLVDTYNNNRPKGGEVYGNGGTIAIRQSKLEHVQFEHMESIGVFEKGLNIECNIGALIGTETASPRLRSPKGYGVDSITYTGKTIYYYTPWVDISGGSGSNATAIALVDWEGTHKITNIVVTCRGEGYGKDDKLTVKLTQPAVSLLSEVPDSDIVVTLSENLPGALVKTGPKRLVVYEQPEYDGNYEVREGTMIQELGALGSPLVSKIIVGGSDAQFQSTSGGLASKANPRNNIVNPNVELTLGTANGSGQFVLPAGVDNSTPYVQEIAKLKVNGTGNKICVISEDRTLAYPTELRVNDFEFADGAQLVIANDSSLRVYAPQSMAGQLIENISFEGKSKRVGFVSQDGLVVPKVGTGMMILFR